MMHDEIKNPVMDDYLKGMNITTVCAKYGISRPTFYRWMKEFGLDKPTEHGIQAVDIGYIPNTDEVSIKMNNLVINIPRGEMFMKIGLMLNVGVDGTFNDYGGKKMELKVVER